MRIPLLRTIATIFTCWLHSLPACAAPAAAVPVLVELFTSEGCSSCPPADRVLSDLVARQPVTGARVVALGEHVDYWDGLGWPDPFASPAFSERQRAYATRIFGAGAFTPQIVVDGQRSLIGSRWNDAVDAIRESATEVKIPVVLTWETGGTSRLRVHIDAASTAGKVFLATTQSGVVSKVARGENGGRTLQHIAVVRELRPIGFSSTSAPFERTLDVTWPATVSTSKGVVVFLQHPSTGRVMGIAALEF